MLSLIFIVLFSVLYFSKGHLTIHSNGSTSQFGLYSSLKWHQNVQPIYNVSIVDIFLDRSLFDYCKGSNYNNITILPILKYHNVDPIQKWAVFMKYPFSNNIVPICRNSFKTNFLTWQDSFVVTWDQPFSLYAQQLGAVAVITNEEFVTQSKYLKLFNVDNKLGLVYGVQIHIFSAVVLNEGGASLLLSLTESYRQNSSLLVDIYDDPNFLDVIQSQTSAFRVLSYLSIILSSLASLSCFNILIEAVDPLGYLNLIPFPIARVLFTFHQDLSVVSSMTALFSWTIMLDHIAQSIQMKKSLKATGVKRKRSIIFISAVMTSLDVVLAVLGDYYGVFGDSAVTDIPAVFFVIVYLSMAFFIVYVIYWMRKTLINMELLVAPSTEKDSVRDSELLGISSNALVVKKTSIARDSIKISSPSVLLSSPSALISPSSALRIVKTTEEKTNEIKNSMMKKSEIGEKIEGGSSERRLSRALRGSIVMVKNTISKASKILVFTSEEEEDRVMTTIKKGNKTFKTLTDRVKLKMKKTIFIMGLGAVVCLLNIMIAVFIALGFQRGSPLSMAFVYVGSIISVQFLSVVEMNAIFVIIHK